jgi:hypothetical protein
MEINARASTPAQVCDHGGGDGDTTMQIGR